MIISEQYSLKDYAKPLHKMTEEGLKELAAEAKVILNDRNDGMSYDIDVRSSLRGGHIYADIKTDTGKEATIEPPMMGKEIKTAEDLADALLTELASRERSLAFVRGDIDGTVFENKWKPAGVEEKYNPYLEPSYPEEEEDRSC